jgi:hypothetical protein
VFREVMLRGAGLNSLTLIGDLAVVAAFAFLMVIAAGLTLRRRIA